MFLTLRRRLNDNIHPQTMRRNRKDLPDRRMLEVLYRKYNRRQFVHPDPLEFLYDYPDVRDREIVGLVASSLAYGRVAQILKSVESVLARIAGKPRTFVESASESAVRKAFKGFKHRFSTGDHVSALLTGVGRIVREHGSLGDCFRKGLGKTDETILPALEKFVLKLDCGDSYLLPLPSKGSPCKRLNLFLRWMVRKDAVDPGGWKGIPPSKLVIPLDTHMANIGRQLGLTGRASPGIGMALDITESFRRISPDDPVRYDFALTRFGIRSELEMRDLLRSLSG